MTRRAALAGLAFGLVLMGCGSGATPTPTPAPSIAATESPASTVAVTPLPATPAGPAEPCADPGCQMFAGEYRATSLAGDFRFRLIGEVWTKVAYKPEILSLRITDDWVVFMSGEVRLREGDGIEMSTDPAQAQAALKALSGIAVTKVDDRATIGGHDAVVFDVANSGDETTQLWGLGDGPGMYFLDPGASVRMHWVDVDGTPFILALEAPTRSFEAFLADSVPVVESITFD
jgi:hypothetical protein